MDVIRPTIEGDAVICVKHGISLSGAPLVMLILSGVKLVCCKL